ncbi:MAG: methyltransferase domain-containing protein [Acidobacteria bacterium]|nr:methyltransferase domain-containing protein [Acidobacteriota bacterium]
MCWRGAVRCHGRVRSCPESWRSVIRDIDALTSPTLKYLRERWWDANFTEFLAETLRPRPGNKILDVGCGEGLAETHIGRLHVSQLRLFGIDLMIERVMVARREAAAHNQRVGFATADASCLPFHDRVFDSTFCVAVLQHIGDVNAAVKEFARVTMPGGRVLVVEPDNSARYSYAATPAGDRAFEISARFFAALQAAKGDAHEAAVGPKLPTLFARCGIEPLEVRLFPVSKTRLGPPSGEAWASRRAAIEQAIDTAPADAVRALGREFLDVLHAYEEEAKQAGSAFVEIQNTMLFATVGQRSA